MLKKLSKRLFLIFFLRILKKTIFFYKIHFKSEKLLRIFKKKDQFSIENKIFLIFRNLEPVKLKFD